jgi:hypothetical protein
MKQQKTYDKAIDMENGIIVENYDVIFYKVEIGNSEDDKFTLWESADGETKNLVSSVDFSDEKEARPGTYKYCRISINKTITLKGTDGDASGSTTVEVSGNTDLDTTDKAVFLFGTEDTFADSTAQDDGFVLTEAISIPEDGATITFTVNIAGTVTNNNSGEGDGDISLDAPSLTFSVE